MEDCSNDRYIVLPGHPEYDGVMTAPGVVEVTIPDGGGEGDVGAALKELLGTTWLPGPYLSHIMYAMPGCPCGWAGYA